MYYPYDFFKNRNLFGKSRKIVAFFMILNEVVLLSLKSILTNDEVTNYMS